MHTGVWCKLWGRIVWAELRSIRKVDGCTKVMANIGNEFLPPGMKGINVWMVDPSCFTGGSADAAVAWLERMEARERLLNHRAATHG